MFSEYLSNLSIVRKALDTDGERTLIILVMFVVIIFLVMYTIRNND